MFRHDARRAAWAVRSATGHMVVNAVSRFSPRLFAAAGRVLKKTGRGANLDGAAGAAYFRAVADDYEFIAQYAGVVASKGALFQGKDVLEIGPGDTRSMGLIAKSRGAATYDGLDGYEVLSRGTDYLRNLYGAILEIEEDRGGWSRAEALLAETGVFVGLHALRRADKKYNLVLSRAALEHVQDIDDLFSTLREVVSDDAVLIHKVDLRDHGVCFDHELDFLSFRERIYGHMASHDRGMPNRLRVPDYLDLGERHGLALVYAGSTHMISPDRVREILARLAPPWRTMPVEVLRVLGVWLVQVGKAHPLADGRRRRSDVDSLPRAPIDKLSRY
jgi:Methyltransferase domain